MPTDWGTPVHLQEALEGLALNPALPEDLIRRLIAHRAAPRELGTRPDLTPGLIDEMITTGRRPVLRSLAANDGLPGAVRLRLAAHPDVSVRAGLAMSRGQDVSAEAFELLLTDAEPVVREFLAGNDAVPGDLRARLAEDPSAQVRAALGSRWPAAPEHVRRALLTDADDSVREAACSAHHPAPPPDLVPALLADPVTRAGVVRHLTLDASTALRLSQDPDADVRVEVARHPRLPPALRDALGADANPRVRVGVFGRQDTPEPLRAAIHAHVSAAPLDVDEEQFERAVAAGELQMLRLDWVRADPVRHAGSPYACFRASVASSTVPLPPEVVARLLADDEIEVRWAMAKSAPHLADVERMDREFDPADTNYAPWRPADMWTFPASVLRRFATDPDPRMRCLAPRDPDLPAGIAARLAADPDAAVRHAVAGHPNLPEQALIALLDDPDERTVRAAAGSPRLPRREMRRLVEL
ncbi:hypothetical protein [Lentzea cavernae]|uniref:Leucine rich repeat variant n=1 Tax=Lentzea cavernae TaxID=2020703 RepID=A0ABQ3MKL9_9PSEU|nr:hypothetical protein [Lentzea cavernae]GHH41471.1 hypothetical protein GCM10017774_36130 [Lentzea cavernae]